MRFFKKLFLIVVVLVIIAFLWLLLAGQTRLVVDAEGEFFEVKPGSTFLSVIDRLHETGRVPGTFWLRLHAKLHPDIRVEAGNFKLDPGMRYRDLPEILQHAKQSTKMLTFLEGWANWEIVDLLVKNGFEKQVVEDCLKNCEFSYDFITPDVKEHTYEGYLYPDTYEVAENETAFSVLDKMLSNFDVKTRELRTSISDFNQGIIKASLIEREVRTSDDRPIVAGIIENRLDEGMKLDMDASVLYALKDWDAVLDYQTLQVDSPYNTRKFGGIPPSPICNPSLASIKAALNPAETNYFYYLHDANGQTYYAETLTEHNRNKALYLK